MLQSLQLPPQSKSVSLPLKNPSLQEAGLQVFDDGWQKLDWQSPFNPHVLFCAQSPQSEPPQSISVSLAFLMPSLQPGDTQVWNAELWAFKLQKPSEQSELFEQPWPSGQRLLQLASRPQSVPVSLPFLALSLHAGKVQVLLPDGQYPVVQSGPIKHGRSGPHFVEQGFPQSG